MSYSMFEDYPNSSMYYTRIYSYKYNADGIRTSKNINDVEHRYTLSGSQIISETWTENGTEYLMIYLYDDTGAPLGIKYRTSAYAADIFDYFFFEKNLQGDIAAIYNANGVKIGSYTYDAWGVCTYTAASGATTLEKSILISYNPFRYRGYYYDTETGFYYLQSRYYNPNWGRFLNADTITDGGAGIIGNNIFIYCANDSINNTDPNGQWIIKNAIKWVTKNIAKPFVKNVQKSLSKVDATYSSGINISGTPSAFIFNLQEGVAIDTKGNVALQGSFAGGFTGGSPGVSITAYQTVTNAPNIGKLNGPGYQMGGSVGVPIYGVPLAIGGDFNIIPDTDLNKTYYGATSNVGFGTPGGEFHVELGETATWNKTQFNIFDIAENIYIKIMEW